MLTLDAHGNPEADLARDIMDGAWRELAPDDRAWINARELPPLDTALHLSIGRALFFKPLPPRTVVPSSWVFNSWRQDAA